MPIKGLTDRGLAFPEIGQIRKGAKKLTNAPGADLTYFRVEFDETDKKAREGFIAAYGNTPAAIRIILPFNDIERMWDAWLEAYTAGRMVARSDGERIIYQLDERGEVIVKNGMGQDGKPVPHPANDIAGRDFKGNAVKFKPTGRLKVIVPELARAAYLTVMTTSIHDIQNISAQLAAFHNLNKGQIAGIPLILRRRPKEISTPTAEGNRVRRKKWLISIEADPEWVKAQLTTLKRLALPGNGLNLLGDGSDHPADLETVDAEFDDDELDGAESGDPIYTAQDDGSRSPQPASVPAARPYSPEQLKAKLEDMKVSLAQYPPVGNEAQIIAMNLSDCFEGNEDKRHAVVFYLTGRESLKDADTPTLKALKKWVNPQKTESGWVMDALAIKEAHAVYAQAMKEQGQMEMEGV